MNFFDTGFQAPEELLKAPIPTCLNILKSSKKTGRDCADWAEDPNNFPEGPEFRIGIDWNKEMKVDLDLFCVPVNSEGWAQYKSDVIFYGNNGRRKSSKKVKRGDQSQDRPDPYIGIEYSGDDRSGERSNKGSGVQPPVIKMQMKAPEAGESRPAVKLKPDDNDASSPGLDEIIRVDLERLPDDIVRIIFFVVSANRERMDPTKLVEDLGLRIFTCWGYGRKGCIKTIDRKNKDYDSLLVGQLYRSPGAWKFTWRGVPFNGGIAQVLPFYTDHLEVEQKIEDC